MQQELEISLSPEETADEISIKTAIAGITGWPIDQISYRILRRSIDARKRDVKFVLKIAASQNTTIVGDSIELPQYKNVHSAEEVHIIGAGPAGLFAALRLLELGLKPVIFERGKNVRDRRRDLAAINKSHIVNPESNYCFGEGGAGTYSDGKLYTRSKKRGDVLRVLKTLVAFGANEDILIDAHPHIGTNKLPQLITQIREKIIECGGEIHFEHKLTGIFSEFNKISGIEINGDKVKCKKLLLAPGHSARDVFYLLHKAGIKIESKAFALGVRVEHPQEIIDKIQYSCDLRSEYLPPASYNLVQQVMGKGVYSFCMCPGGIIAPCATNPEEIVTNGWSPSKRNNPFANSGIVVSIEEKDFDPKQSGNPLLALEYQQAVERSAWLAGGGGQIAPAQRMVHFTNNRQSPTLPECSYLPGLRSAKLSEVLPASVNDRLVEAFKAFGKKMPGYFTNDAVLVAPESRTSSPVRIPRKRDTLEHIEVEGLYPCGEGAGFAGGIASAAMDGERCAEQIALSFGIGISQNK